MSGLQGMKGIIYSNGIAQTKCKTGQYLRVMYTYIEIHWKWTQGPRWEIWVRIQERRNKKKHYYGSVLKPAEDPYNTRTNIINGISIGKQTHPKFQGPTGLGDCFIFGKLKKVQYMKISSSRFVLNQ